MERESQVLSSLETPQVPVDAENPYLRVLTQPKVYLCKLKDCTGEFPSKKELNAHKVVAHEYVKCTQKRCTRVFMCKRRLDTHLDRCHGISRETSSQPTDSPHSDYSPTDRLDRLTNPLPELLHATFDYIQNIHGLVRGPGSMDTLRLQEFMGIILRDLGLERDPGLGMNVGFVMHAVGVAIGLSASTVPPAPHQNPPDVNYLATSDLPLKAEKIEPATCPLPSDEIRSNPEPENRPKPMDLDPSPEGGQTTDFNEKMNKISESAANHLQKKHRKRPNFVDVSQTYQGSAISSPSVFSVGPTSANRRGPKPSVYPCSKCAKVFPYKKELNQHKYREHPGRHSSAVFQVQMLPLYTPEVPTEAGAYACIETGCQQTFSTEIELLTHVRDTHEF